MLVNYTVDAQSPVITFIGAGWNPITQSSDSSWASYDNKTAVATPEAGDYWTFDFHGTGIWVYGAKRANHGQYNITLDSSTPATANGLATPDQFSVLLYSAANLSLGDHTIKVVNSPVSSDLNWLDLDYLVWEGSLADSSRTVVVDNTNSSMKHIPDVGDWESETDVNSFNGTLSRTQSNMGQMELTFFGEAVAVYGRVGPDDGDFMCSVDGGPSTTYTGHSSATAYQQTLCTANNLEKGVEHTISLANMPSGSKVWLEVDYARIWGVDAAAVPPFEHHTPKLAKYMGIMGAGIVFLLLAGSLGYFCYRKRRRRVEDRGTAYKTVVLDDGEDWHHLTPFPANHFPGDALGVYSPRSPREGEEAHAATAAYPTGMHSPTASMSSSVRPQSHYSISSRSGLLSPTTPTSGSGRIARREEDAGLLMTDEDDVERLPPDYHQVPARARQSESGVRPEAESLAMGRIYDDRKR